jgi:hypothetical protein
MATVLSGMVLLRLRGTGKIDGLQVAGRAAELKGRVVWVDKELSGGAAEGRACARFFIGPQPTADSSPTTDH